VLPLQQHAWNDALRTDSVGNHLLPRHYRLFMLNLDAEVNEESAELMRVTEDALWAGIRKAKVGNRISDISHAVQQVAEGAGFGVVREYVGHGLGQVLHEDLQVPNVGPPGRGPKIVEGMTIAIEPMVNLGGWETEVLSDGWTVVTADRSLSAHYEHSIAVTADEPFVLTVP
jgi:methionyl aminopeptidase